jgi:hypothetical protein
MRFVLAALALVASAHASANTFSTDATDLWWNAAEAGWGVNVNHQGEILFLTFFVYGPNNAPTWYSASSLTYSGQSGGALVFTGALHQTSGPWLGSPTFNPNSVSYRQVGTATFTLTTISSATLSYSVDGTNVSKSLTRYSFRNNNLTGTYIGATIGTYSNCRAPATNGYSESAARFGIAQSGATTTIQELDPSTGASCTYTGTYAQDGRTGMMSGNYTCTGGVVGTFQASEIDANVQGITARVTATDNFCSFSGRIGGLRTGS